MQEINLKAKVTVRNNILLELMEKNGISGIAELGRKLGICSQSIGRFLYLKSLGRIPKYSNVKKNKNLLKLAKYFNVNPEYIVSEELHFVAQEVAEMTLSKEKTEDIGNFIAGIQKKQLLLESDPVERAEISSRKEEIARVLDTLTEREKMVIKLRFGFDDGRVRSLDEVGRIYDVTRERVRQIEAKALRKLRHPYRSHTLREWR